MSNLPRVATLALMLSLSALGSTACGGGGGGGGGPPPPGAVGSFRLSEMGGAVDMGAPRFGTFTGTAIADGSTLEMTTTLNDQGALTFGITNSRNTVLDADGSFTVLIGTTPTAVGWFDPSGDVGLTGSVNTGNTPFFQSYVRAWSSTASNASFVGTYHFGGMGADGSAIGLVGTATADGAGEIAISAGAIVNEEGSISADGADVAEYDVASNGTTTIGASGQPQFSGGLSPDGDFLVVSGATTSGDSPRTYVFLRAASTGTAATLTGTYRVVGLVYDFVTPSARSMTGTMVADGTGGGTVQWTTNEGGVITNDAAFAVSYGVSANGGLSMNTPGGHLQGGVSEDGNRGFLAGGTDIGSDPILLLFVRQ